MHESKRAGMDSCFGPEVDDRGAEDAARVRKPPAVRGMLQSCSAMLYPGFGGSVFNSKHLRDTTCLVPKHLSCTWKPTCANDAARVNLSKRLYSPLFPGLCFALSVPSADLDPPKRWLSTSPGAMNALFSGGCARRCGQGDQHVRVVDKAFQLCQQWALEGVI